MPKCRCGQVYLRHRRIVAGMFYDSFVCESCGRVHMPGASRLRIRSVKDIAIQRELTEKLRQGWAILSDSHGSTRSVVLIDPKFLTPIPQETSHVQAQ